VKEKRSDWWKATAGLAVVAVLAVGLGLLFRGRPQPPVATGPTATATTTYTPTTTPVSAATPTPALPEGTPGPRRLSAAVQVPVPEGFLDLEDVEGNTIVGRTRVSDVPQIVLMDLVSGDVRQISHTVGRGSYAAHISGPWVVWIEIAESADGSDERRLKAYDRETDHEFALEAAPYDLDLSGDVVVWEEWRGQETNWDVFAYNLRTGQQWVIAERRGAQEYPRVSGSWVIYENMDEQGTILRAYHLQSGEDLVLGQIYYTRYTAADRPLHDISNGLVVWAAPSGEFDYMHQLMGTDLNNPDAQPFPIMTGNFGTLRLFDGILVYHEGRGKVLYDVQRGERLATVEGSRVVSTLVISGAQVMWITTDDHLYVARIER